METVKLGEIKLEKAGVMIGYTQLCKAGHLYVRKVDITYSPEYKEFFLEFILQDQSWITIVLTNEELVKFITKLLLAWLLKV